MSTQLKQNRLKIYIIAALLSLTMSSCGFGVLFQIRFDFDITKDEIIEFAENNKISMDDLYILSDMYPNLLTNLAEQSNLSADTMKFYKQPLQVICYDNKDSTVGFIPNCLVGGTFTSASLKWNDNKDFDEFPIQTPRLLILNSDSSNAIDTRPVTILPDSIISYIYPLTDRQNEIVGKKENLEEYKIFIFCGLMLENYSEDLIEEVQKSVEIGEKEGKSISVYYIITDGLFDYQIH